MGRWHVAWHKRARLRGKPDQLVDVERVEVLEGAAVRGSKDEEALPHQRRRVPRTRNRRSAARAHLPTRRRRADKGGDHARRRETMRIATAALDGTSRSYRYKRSGQRGASGDSSGPGGSDSSREEGSPWRATSSSTPCRRCTGRRGSGAHRARRRCTSCATANVAHAGRGACEGAQRAGGGGGGPSARGGGWCGDWAASPGRSSTRREWQCAQSAGAEARRRPWARTR